MVASFRCRGGVDGGEIRDSWPRGILSVLGRTGRAEARDAVSLCNSVLLVSNSLPTCREALIDISGWFLSLYRFPRLALALPSQSQWRSCQPLLITFGWTSEVSIAMLLTRAETICAPI